MGLLGEECNALLGQATHMMKTIRLVLLGLRDTVLRPYWLGSSNPYNWPYTWVTRVLTLLIGVIFTGGDDFHELAGAMKFSG